MTFKGVFDAMRTVINEEARLRPDELCQPNEGMRGRGVLVLMTIYNQNRACHSERSEESHLPGRDSSLRSE